ncbi:MAG: CopG family transcriptional regulator [Omnitrophica WOR_2 bacterium RIFCSPHIGHO2_02_FULL_52_10]|nr:MAG: CopG family transcriptional regulator [Omnitrophica WOR_2 bacterium RIFCSPHIGHO2_02_FULL_52_10]
MIKLSKRTTIYLDPDLHKIIKFKALETSRSVSDLVNDALKHELAEDQEDLEAFKQRESEGSISYEELLKTLKDNGKI